MGAASSKSEPKNLVLETARRGPFLVSLNVQGFLDSRKNATLASQVEGQTTIISIIPEGTWVTQGEVVCELDASVLREQAKQQEIATTQAEAAMATARETLEIQKTQNESDIAAAKLKADLAKLDLEKYSQGDFPQQKSELEGNVTIAKEEQIRAKENLDFIHGQVKKGFSTQNELDASRVALQQANLKLQGAEELLNVLINYTYKRTIAELTANAMESEREMARVKLKADSARTQCEKEQEAAKLTYDVEREKLERLQNQIEACTLRAPQDGEVVYATLSTGGGRSSQPVTIEPGAVVRERQPIINLPDVSQMKVDCRIHESLIGSIHKGLPARVRVDAYPDEIYAGEISHVSSVPMTGSWPNTDLREYQTEVQLTGDVERIRKLRPGLTSQVEILVDNRSNVLQIPVQSVLNIADKQVVFIYDGQQTDQRFVKIGQANQTHIEILEGVDEGERVVMNPRSQFASQISSLEAELNQARSKTDPKLKAGHPASEEEASQKKTNPAGDGAGRVSGPGVPGGNGAPGGRPGGGFGGGDRSAFFTKMDKNSDGKLSAEEIPEERRERMLGLDKDGDGTVSKAEFLAGGRPPQPKE
jgi:HlyD family secretion protein